nr:DUF559 domain-containing protein [Rhodococcus sp. B10]
MLLQCTHTESSPDQNSWRWPIPSSSIARRYVRVLPEVYCTEEPSTIARCYAITLWQPLGRTLIALGLPLRINYWVGSYLCDLVDEWAMVIVEVDGRQFRSAPDVFSRHRRRQNELVLCGWLVLRYSAFDVLSDPEKTARQIVEVVRRRRNSRRRRE